MSTETSRPITQAGGALRTATKVDSMISLDEIKFRERTKKRYIALILLGVTFMGLALALWIKDLKKLVSPSSAPSARPATPDPNLGPINVTGKESPKN